MSISQQAPNLVKLKCVRENKKLKVKVISPGYDDTKYCKFPRSMKDEGSEYLVLQTDITFLNNLYYIKNNNIQVIDPLLVELVNNIKVYNVSKEHECNICMTDMTHEVIYNCGHSNCIICSTKVKSCPLCRIEITHSIKKEQFDLCFL